MAEASGRRTSQSDSTPPVSITVFFPCYNEQDNVAKVAEQAIQVLEDLRADYEVIIVDDGSADNTGRSRRSDRGGQQAGARDSSPSQPRLRRRSAIRAFARPPRNWSSTPTATPSST